MSGRAKFVHWQLSEFADIPHNPMFNIFVDGAVQGTTVTGMTAISKYGLSLGMFPDAYTWKTMVQRKLRCPHCWAATRGATDWNHHKEKRHKTFGLEE